MPVPEINKTPQVQLVEAINRLYKTQLTPEDVQFYAPELINNVVNDVLVPSLRNSRVGISNVSGGPYEFATTLHFNRLSLDVLFRGRSTTFAGSVTHSHDLLPLLRERLGINVTADDVTGHQIENTVGYPFSMLLMAAPSSLLLYGEVNITLTEGEMVPPEGYAYLADDAGIFLTDIDAIYLVGAV